MALIEGGWSAPQFVMSRRVMGIGVETSMLAEIGRDLASHLEIARR
ncbi:MAG TPA: hypothetical protein VED87_05485 [Methylocystis sp.]|nr:hypothetical protein [Methylocystis sp.]